MLVGLRALRSRFNLMLVVNTLACFAVTIRRREGLAVGDAADASSSDVNPPRNSVVSGESPRVWPPLVRRLDSHLSCIYLVSERGTQTGGRHRVAVGGVPGGLWLGTVALQSVPTGQLQQEAPLLHSHDPLVRSHCRLG